MLLPTRARHKCDEAKKRSEELILSLHNLGHISKEGDHPQPLTFVKKINYYPECTKCGEPCEEFALECAELECNYLVHWKCVKPYGSVYVFLIVNVVSPIWIWLSNVLDATSLSMITSSLLQIGRTKVSYLKLKCKGSMGKHENVIYKYWAVGSGSPLVYACPALYVLGAANYQRPSASASASS
ncbi:hypothetical protein Gotri_013867 [Gossypium trilobum]|uniref:DC1 domain-containing protein n=1 Tax=Gossypium trilobum TaxID=34281 RepID=A0A7J9DUV8_9ROSI|nr:hypothetical protein [Gossypium trilobum]